MADPKVSSMMELLGVSTRDTRLLFNLLDVNDDGSIGIWELVEGINRLQGQASSLDAHEIMQLVKYVMRQNDEILQLDRNINKPRKASAKRKQRSFGASCKLASGR